MSHAWISRAAAVAGIALMGASLVACFGPEKDTHPDKVLTKRRALFKQYTRMMDPIGQVASGHKDFKREEFLASVQELEKLADKPWAYFTPDGNYPPTRATPQVWSDPQRFAQATQHFEATVHQLASTAQQGSFEEIRKAVDDVTQSCKSCHHDFRLD